MQELLQQIQKALEANTAAEQNLHQLWAQFSTTMHDTRKMLGLTLDDLKDRTGISRSKLSYLENGERNWSVETAAKVIEGLKEPRG